MHFDGTIQLGSILNAVAILGAALALYGRFSAMETKVNAIWEWWTDEVADRRKAERRA